MWRGRLKRHWGVTAAMHSLRTASMHTLRAITIDRRPIRACTLLQYVSEASCHVLRGIHAEAAVVGCSELALGGNLGENHRELGWPRLLRWSELRLSFVNHRDGAGDIRWSGKTHIAYQSASNHSEGAGEGARAGCSRVEQQAE